MMNNERRPSRDGETARTMTVLIGADQRAEIDDLRRRYPGRSEAAFWSIVLGDGIGLFDYQLHEEEVAKGSCHTPSDIAMHPDIAVHGPPADASPASIAADATIAVAIPVDDETLTAIDRLRARRPDWTDALFWREVLEWGTDLLDQRLNDEDDERAGIVRDEPPLGSFGPGLGWFPF